MNTAARRVTAILAFALTLVLTACAAETQERPTAAPQTDSAPETSREDEPQPDTASEEDATTRPAENPGLSQAALDHRLRDAAWANNVAEAEQLIEWGADVNAEDDTQQSAYLIATSEGRLELLKLTLEHGADVRSLDSWNGTGLIRAAERGRWDIVGELIQADVPLDHVNRIGYQAIHEAVWLGRDDLTYNATIRVLIAGGVDFSTPSVNEGLTPLQMAESRGFSGQASVLRVLTQGTVPRPEDADAALLTAAEAGEPNDAALALRAGANPQLTNDAGVSVREIAASGGHYVTAQLLEALGG